MRDFWQDVRFSLRILGKNPGFALVAALTLALGIGGNTAVFSVVHGVLLKPLPYNDPDRLVRVFESNPAARFPKFAMSPANFLDYRGQNQVFDSMAVYTQRDRDLNDHERPERLSGMAVSSDYFRVLGFQPLVGRAFTLEDERPGQHAAVLSYSLWQRRFAGDRDIVGKTIRLSGEAYTVVGVMPPGLQHVGGEYRSPGHGETVDIWMAFTMQAGRAPRGAHFLNVVARLKPGVTREQAGAELNVIAAALERQYPGSNRDWRIRLEPLRREIVGRIEPLLMVLMGAVGFVLLIACVNVANLLLGRAMARQREIAVRTALGAGRARLVRQMLTESLAISAPGGALGLLAGYWGIDALVALSPDKLPRLHMVGFDLRVFLFAVALTVITGVLFGLAPALHASKADLSQALKQGGRWTTGSRRHSRARNALVIGEVSLAFVLLTSAGLLMRSFLALMSTPPGFNPRGVLTMSVSVPYAKYEEARHVVGFYQQLLDRLAALPGVEAAGASTDLPWTGYDENSGFTIEGRPQRQDDDTHARYHAVTEDYFRAIGVPLLEGRWFTRRDDSKAPLVILINQSMARRFWPGESAVGKRLTFRSQPREQDWLTIVGVVGDVKDSPAAAGAEPAFYWPITQQIFRSLFVAVRSDGDPMALAGAIRREMARLDPEVPLAEMRPLEQIAAAAVSGSKFALLAVGAFAFIAMALAVVGIYGVIAYAVSQRVHEIGIRVALGAQRSDVLGMVIHHGAVLAAAGTVLGIAGSFGASRLLATLLYGVTPHDPATLAAVSFLLVAVAMLACLLPARRAARVDPVVALREE